MRGVNMTKIHCTHVQNFQVFKKVSRSWWCIPVTLALETQKQEDQDQPGLHQILIKNKQTTKKKQTEKLSLIAYQTCSQHSPIPKTEMFNIYNRNQQTFSISARVKASGFTGTHGLLYIHWLSLHFRSIKNLSWTWCSHI